MSAQDLTLAYTIGDSTKSGKATKIKFYMQAPPSLQAFIIPNLCVRACVKCIVWLHKTKRKTEYIMTRKILVKKFHRLPIKMKIF